MGEEKCLCQKSFRINEESAWRDVWEELKKLHDECSAVKFLISDFESWFKNNKEPKETASHQSALVLAFRRGHLDRVTSPIHHYILGKQTGNKNNNAIVEKWWNDNDDLKRHQQSRMWIGRVMELKVAEWLEENGWVVKDLEAWNPASADITAQSPDKRETLIEVKYIGQEDDEFKAIVESYAKSSGIESKGICVTNRSPYVAFNYALFRIFEATHQLKKQTDTTAQKETVLVIDGQEWPNMEIPLNDYMRVGGRYDFFENEEEQNNGWRNFFCNTIKSQKNIKKYGDDLFNMPAVIKALSKITILRIKDWSLEKMMEWSPSGNDKAGLV